MRTEFDGDMGLLGSGSLRLDEIVPQGPIKLDLLYRLQPFPDDIVILKIKGQDILAALANAVSKYPAHDGRFPQISGFSFVFDSREPVG